MLRILISLLLIIFSVIPGHSEVVEDITKLNKRAEGVEVKTGNVNEKEGQKRAQEAYKYIQSIEFQKRISEANTEAKKQFKEIIGESNQVQGSKEGAKKEAMHAGDARVYVFISSSIPRTTVRNYIASASMLKNEKISFVMRGFIGKDQVITPLETQRYIGDILKVNPSCSSNCESYNIPVFVDPRLFKKYSIDKVPAVVYSRGGADLLSDTAPGSDNETAENAAIIYGDESLETLLSKVKGAIK